MEQYFQTMKSKKSGRIESYDTTVVLKKYILTITKSDSMSLSKLSWQTKKVKLQKKKLGDREPAQVICRSTS